MEEAPLFPVNAFINKIEQHKQTSSSREHEHRVNERFPLHSCMNIIRRFQSADV